LSLKSTAWTGGEEFRMKVLVVGQGGREHALCWKLKQSRLVTKVYCAPGNAGTALEAENVDISALDAERLVKFARNEEIALTVIGPEAPLVAGVADAFQKAGLRVFGPSKAAAQLEGSKQFAKEIMRAAKVPTAEFRAFHNAEDAIQFVQEREETGLVVKADGLAAGKGVTVCSSKDQAIAAIQDAMVKRVFGTAGDTIVIEERMSGPELSVLALVDGRTIVPLESAQDHKAAYDDDQGPNTGGMGAYSPAPIARREVMDEVIDRVLIPTVHELRRQGIEYRGVLYAGLMLTSQGPRVLEFNTRLGDPETQPVLMRLKSDLFEVLCAAADGKLKDFQNLEWDSRHGCRGISGQLREGEADPRSGSGGPTRRHQGVPRGNGEARPSRRDGRRSRSGGDGSGEGHLGRETPGL
jgi:phosphoribosylamine---glycine ligase